MNPDGPAPDSQLAKQQPVITPRPSSVSPKSSHDSGVREVRSAQFIGPIPPPDLLGGYESVCPGAADRIIRMAEDEGAARRALECSIVNAQIDEGRREFDEAKRGQICAVVIAVTAMFIGAYTASAGHDVAGGLIGIGGVTSIVTTFIVGRSHTQQAAQTKEVAVKPKQKRKQS